MPPPFLKGAFQTGQRGVGEQGISKASEDRVTNLPTDKPWQTTLQSSY